MARTETNVRLTWGRIVFFASAASFILLAIGLFLTNYIAALSLGIGIILSWPIIFVLNFAIRRVRLWAWKRSTFIALFIILFIACVLITILSPFFLALQGPPRNAGIKSYKATIAAKGAYDKFTRAEEIVFNCSEISTVCHNKNGRVETDNDIFIRLPEREITGTSRGLFLMEVAFSPLEVDNRGSVAINSPDGITSSGLLCWASCPSTVIELRDMPINSFHEARDADDLKTYPYIEDETITWSIPNVEKGIAFSYIPRPYNHLHPVLQPFLGLSSLSHYIFAIAGFICTLIITPIVKPVIIDIIKSKFASSVNKSIETKPKKKVKLIVSSKGDEKEIEIDE